MARIVEISGPSAVRPCRPAARPFLSRRVSSLHLQRGHRTPSTRCQKACRDIGSFLSPAAATSKDVDALVQSLGRVCNGLFLPCQRDNADVPTSCCLSMFLYRAAVCAPAEPSVSQKPAPHCRVLVRRQQNFQAQNPPSLQRAGHGQYRDTVLACHSKRTAVQNQHAHEACSSLVSQRYTQQGLPTIHPPSTAAPIISHRQGVPSTPLATFSLAHATILGRGLKPSRISTQMQS